MLHLDRDGNRTDTELFNGASGGACELAVAFDPDGGGVTLGFRSGAPLVTWGRDTIGSQAWIMSALSLTMVHDGHLYAGIDSRLAKITRTDVGIQWDELNFSAPVDSVAWNGNGLVYALSGEALWRIDPKLIVVGTIAVASGAQALLIDSEERAYVGGTTMARYLPDATVDPSFAVDTPMQTIFELRSGPAGSIFALYGDDSDTLRLRRFDDAGITIWDVPAGVRLAETIVRHSFAVDTIGDVIVAGTATGVVLKFDFEQGVEEWRVRVSDGV